MILENPAAARRFQRLSLEVKILVFRGNAGVANLH
jgi:hypothetical protein